MAERPKDLEKLILTKEANKAGCYLLTFYVNGRLTPVMIDDWIPVDRRGRPIGCTTKSQEVWCILFEKAWAKLHGSYARTESGLPNFACYHLMGTAGFSNYHPDFKTYGEVDKLWRKLKKCDDYQYSIMAASHGSGERGND